VQIKWAQINTLLFYPLYSHYFQTGNHMSW